MSWWDDLTGHVSDQDYNKVPQVSGVDPSTYQISGLGNYLSSLGALQNQPGPTIDQTNSTVDRNAQMANIGQLQGLANGTGPSPAQQFLANNQQQALRNIQSQALTQQAGTSPGLAFRGLMNAQGALQAQTASQGALMQQQAQQQAQQELASQLAGLNSQDFGQAQAIAQNQRANTAQTAELVGQQYGMSQGQTANNIAAGNAARQLQMYQRASALDRLQQNASQAQMPYKMGATAIGTGAGFALTGGNPLGAMAGAQLGGSLFGGGGGGSMSPALMMALAQGQGGGGGGLTPEDRGYAANGVGPSANYYNSGNMAALGNPFFSQSGIGRNPGMMNGGGAMGGPGT